VIVATLTGKALGWAGFGALGFLGFTHSDITEIIVACIGAFGLVVSTRHGKRLLRVERAVNATRGEARASAEELATMGREDRLELTQWREDHYDEDG
jgi:hypothetical protein